MLLIVAAAALFLRDKSHQSSRMQRADEIMSWLTWRIRSCWRCLAPSSCDPTLETPFIRNEEDPAARQPCETAETKAEGDYRVEFLAVGLAHGTLAFIRFAMMRDSSPHTWGIWQSHVATKEGLQRFHMFLSERGLRAGSQNTVLDLPFQEYDWCVSFSLTLQFTFLLLIAASLVCEVRAWHSLSQISCFMGGGTALVSSLSYLVPSYAKMTQLPEYFSGCGKEFDSFMQFSVSGVLGMMFATPLGRQVFGILFAVPVAAVRGI